MSAIGVLILQLVMLRLADGQFGGGGPSTFGYDASSACSKPYSRHGRARFEKLPCDFRRQNWCTVPGSAYPWHAVRRFVQENQGLMRRMYGDEIHINIIKAELEKNDIELEYDDRYQRYPEDSRRFQYENDYEFIDLDRPQHHHQHRQKAGDNEAFEGRSFTSGSFEEPTTERTRKYTKSPADYTRPHTGPTDSTTSTTARPTSASTSAASSTETSSTSGTVTTTPETPPSRQSTSSISPVSSADKISTSTETIGHEKTNNSSSSSSAVPEKVASTAPAVTLADIARIKNSSINEIPGQMERFKDHHSFDVTESPTTNEPAIVSEETTVEPGVTARSPTTSPVDRIDDAVADENFKEVPPLDEEFAASEQQSQQQFRPRPEYRPTGTKPETPNRESQLFQDVAAKDQQDSPVLKLRGVNACPVKEEVVAPFWANNTRGEVLALLNLYPFEQYVHWEKCTHENKQMYCRDGCRCEQQYRLHRLLAYDPNNECRGIFSDWFKFPSCCVCRCYDLPVEFRVTSRSPRMQKQKLILRPPGHRRG